MNFHSFLAHQLFAFLFTTQANDFFAISKALSYLTKNTTYRTTNDQQAIPRQYTQRW